MLMTSNLLLVPVKLLNFHFIYFEPLFSSVLFKQQNGGQ